MMKKLFAMLLVLLLVFSGCAKKPQETLPPETTAPVSTEAAEPELTYAEAEINGVAAVLATLSRGETLDVVGAFDETQYAVRLETGYGLVEKGLVRLETEPEYTAWTGYAYRGAEFYDNYRLAGDPMKTLDTNAQVTVHEDLGWCLLAEYEGSYGYLRPESIAKNPIGSEKKGSSSGGSSAAPAEGEDGGEISMGVSGTITLLSVITPQEGSVSGRAVVLADETQVVLGYFDWGDRIPVVKGSEKDGMLTVYLDGLYAQVSGAYVCMDGEAVFAPWDGKTTDIVSLYADRWMLGSPVDRLNAGTEIRVLYELEDCCLVETADSVGYLRTGSIQPAGSEPQQTGPAPQKETVPAQEEDDTEDTPSATKPETPEEKPAETPQATQPAETPTEKPEEKPEESTGATEATQPQPTSPPEWTPPML